jgi:hypothetical protein
LKPLQVGLAGLYFLYVAYLAYWAFEADQIMQPGTAVADPLPFVAPYAAIAAFWGALGFLELRGHHRQNISGSILSMMVVAGAALVEDSHIDLVEGEALLVILVTGMLGLLDLRALPERRTFPAVMSIDTFLLISYSLLATYPRGFSGFATIIEGAGILAGVGMLALGLFWLARPLSPLRMHTQNVEQSTP